MSQMNDYLAWPYAAPAGERLAIVLPAYDAVRALLDATEIEFGEAVDCRMPHGNLQRLAHELGSLAQMETALQQMVDEAVSEIPRS